jgi:hypothetical protein
MTLAVAGCDMSGDLVVAPPVPPDGSARAVLDAAFALNPVPLGSGGIVGVLDADQTPTERTVIYITEEGTALYRFVRDKGWRPDHVLSSAPSDPNVNAAAAFAAMDPYTNAVGRVSEFESWLGGFVYTNISAASVTQTGTYDAYVYDGDGVPSFVEGYSYPASKQVGGTDYFIPQAQMIWKYWFGSSTGTCDPISVLCSFPYNTHQARLTWYMRVTHPVVTSITSGPTHIPYVGSYSWTATASGGDAADPLTVVWEYSVDNVSWVTKGTASSLTLSFTNQNQPPFWLRFTAESGGRTGTAVRYITVASPLLLRLVAYITGPQYIQRYQWAQYFANVGGGLAPYTYKWRSRDAQGWNFGAWSPWFSTGAQNYTFASINTCSLNHKQLQVEVTDAVSNKATNTPYDIFITNPC